MDNTSDIDATQADSVDENVLSTQASESPEISVQNEPVSDEQDDDDFGSFDEASFEEFQAPEPEPEAKTATGGKALFTSATFQNLDELVSKLDELLESIFPATAPETNSNTDTLLNAEATEKLASLSRPPRLNPPNWIKLKIRHNLLVNLGVPINLDELDSPNSVNITNLQQLSHSRRRFINEQDIDWSEFDIPEFETLNISTEQKQELLHKTNMLLSKIEEDNLSNTSQLFLESSLESSLDAKLAQLKENYLQLRELSSVWRDQMKELRNSQEIYESVVQNMVGYSQKLQRNEFIEHLKKKGKKGKRTF